MIGVTRGTFKKDDIIASTTVVCNAGQYNRLGAYQVKAGEQIAIGYGDQSGQDNAIGRAYMLLQSGASTPVNGTVRVSLESAQDMPLETLFESNTEALSSSTDRTKQIPLPEHLAVATEDKKIVVYFKPDATATLTKADSTILLDITRRLV